MSNPSLEHYKYLNNIFSYLNKTKNYGLDLTLDTRSNIDTKSNLDIKSSIDIQSKSNTINLIGISDSDWGGDLDTRKSTSGNIFVLSSNLNTNIAISWISKLQKIVAILSVEAEYIALKEATKESLYLNNFIKELFSYNSIAKYSNIFNITNIIKTDS